MVVVVEGSKINVVLGGRLCIIGWLVNRRKKEWNM